MRKPVMDIWIVVGSAGFSDRVDPGVYGVYSSEALAEEHRSRMGDPESFEVEWAQVLDVLDPLVFGGAS